MDQRLNPDIAAAAFRVAQAAGHPFALPPGPQDDGYVLELTEAGATLHRLRGGERDHEKFCPASVWAALAPVVLADFNPRLAAKGMPAGAWPRVGGKVYICDKLGRELGVALVSSIDGLLTRDAIEDWSVMRPRDRLVLWRMVHAPIVFGRPDFGSRGRRGRRDRGVWRWVRDMDMDAVRADRAASVRGRA